MRKLLILVVNIAVVLGVVAAAEWGARRFRTARLGPGSERPMTIRDRWTAWRNNPHYQRVDITHNAQGFRRRKLVQQPKPKNTIRIFFMGGSAAYGSEGLLTEVDKTWVRLYDNQLIDHYLETSLQSRHPGRQIEVINAATNMYRLHQTQAAISSRLLPYEPDLIISMDGHNDMSGIMSARSLPYDPYAETDFEAEFQKLANPDSMGALSFQIATWLRNESVFFSMLQQRFQRFGGGEFDLPKGPARAIRQPVPWELLTEREQQLASARVAEAKYVPKAARRIAALLREEQVPVLFALQPELILSGKMLAGTEPGLRDYYLQITGPYVVYMYETLSREIRNEMAEGARRGEYGFVDLTHVFDAEGAQVFSDYCHLTPLGNEILARNLLEEVERALAAQLRPAIAAASR